MNSVFGRRDKGENNDLVKGVEDGVVGRAREDVGERSMSVLSCAEESNGEYVFLQEVTEQFEVGVALHEKRRKKVL